MTLAVLVIASLFFHSRLAGTAPGREDVHYAWNDGVMLAHGQNPYMRILTSDMRNNTGSFATYMPVYYLLSAGTYRIGVTDYMDWLKLWRPVCEIAQFSIAAFLLFMIAGRASVALAICSSLFFFFNRWTIAVVSMAHLDTSALLFCLLSLYFFERRKTLSPLLFGVSIAVKQMAIFLIPFYLLWEFQRGPRATATRRTVRAGLLLGVIPAMLALPFLCWSASGFFKSILFSATRLPSSDFLGKSFDAAIGLVGLPAKLPMLGLLFLALVGTYTRRIGRYATALIVFAVFLDFNSVLYAQYMVWIVPMFPLAVFGDWLGAHPLPEATSESMV